MAVFYTVAFSFGPSAASHQPPSGEHWKLTVLGSGEVRDAYNSGQYAGVTDGTNDAMLIANSGTGDQASSNYAPVIGSTLGGHDIGHLSMERLHINDSYYLVTYNKTGTPSGYASGVQLK